MADRTCPPCLDPEIIVPISRQTTAVFKTGSWTASRPRFAEKTSPCRAACPAGNDIVGMSRQLSRLSPEWAERLSQIGKQWFDELVGEVGNYTQSVSNIGAQDTL